MWQDFMDDPDEPEMQHMVPANAAAAALWRASIPTLRAVDEGCSVRRYDLPTFNLLVDGAMARC